jgi:hypothetical protein
MSSGGTGAATVRAASGAGAVNLPAVNDSWDEAIAIGSGTRTKQASSYITGGVWVQVAYALIDLGLVMANGVAAFFLVHPAAGMRHVMDSAYKEVITHQPLSGYGGFLILYAGLILLFCQGQDLYRTPRKRSVIDESMAVVKAVSFATLLMTAFIYLTGVNIVGREVVAVEFTANAIALSAICEEARGNPSRGAGHWRAECVDHRGRASGAGAGATA